MNKGIIESMEKLERNGKVEEKEKKITYEILFFILDFFV